MIVEYGFMFEPRDLWVGAFWCTDESETHRALTVYLTVLPCFPIRLRFIARKEAGDVGP